MAIKKVTDFPQAVGFNELQQQQQIDSQAEIAANPIQPKGVNLSEGDLIEKDFAGQGKEATAFEVRPTNTPTLGAVMAELKTDDSALNTDPRALENISTAPCIEAQVVLTADQESRVESVSAIAATLENTKGMNTAKIPYATRKQLAEIADAMKDLPTPDAFTYSDNRKVLIPSEVRDIPNRLAKNKSMLLLEKIIGEKLTANVVQRATQAGVCFYQKPALWLSQRLSYELSRRQIWDKVEEIKDYDPEQDGTNEAIAPQALAKLFSWSVVEQLQIVARIRQISIIHATKIMVERVCQQAADEKAPKDYSEKYDNSATLEQLVASA